MSESRERKALVGAVAVLRHFQGVGQVVGEVRPGHWMVTDRRGRWFSIWDNGGEAGVELVNYPGPPRFAPLTKWSMVLTAGTVAYRLACLVRGEPIDCDEELDEEATECLFRS